MSDFSADAVVQAIYEGRIDEAFDDVLMAMQQRLKAAGSQVTWRFDWNGRTIEKTQLPLGVCRTFQAITGQSYTVMHPANAEHARAIIAAVLVQEGMPINEALTEADNANGWEIAHSMVEATVDGPPSDGRSTPSSRSSRASRGTGRRPSSSSNGAPTSPSSSPAT